MTAVWFVALAALGALTRAEAGRVLNRGFPLGTLVVNVAGSFLLGILAGAGNATVVAVGVGGLGALTTFSSFARDAVALVEERRAGAAALYVALTL
ncbi:MAG: CrcB family protein, partial [Actinomycetota bacterium]